MTIDELQVLKVKAALLGKRYIKVSYQKDKHGYYSSSFPTDSMDVYTDQWVLGFPSYTLCDVEFRDTL